MDERDALRLASRRALLLAAIRHGDARLAARAASRLRVPGAVITPGEHALARDARRTVGRAIVNARLPRRPSAPLRTEAAIPLPPDGRRPYAVGVAIAAALLVAFLFSSGVGRDPGEAGGAPEIAASEPQRAALLAVSRGRTISLADEIVAVQESPAPTVAPTAAVTASSAAARTGAPAATAGSGAGRTPGATGSGSGRGAGGGIVSAPSPTAVPRPTATPAVPPAGFFRFTILVYDSSSGRPLADVCVIVGTISCGAPWTLTDANGRWSADVPVTSATTSWDVSFVKTGYATLRRTLQLAAGRTSPYQVFLRRR